MAGAIRTVIEGGTWLSRPVVEKLARLATGGPAQPEEPALTSREWQVLELIAQGWDNVRIAGGLGCCEG